MRRAKMAHMLRLGQWHRQKARSVRMPGNRKSRSRRGRHGSMPPLAMRQHRMQSRAAKRNQSAACAALRCFDLGDPMSVICRPLWCVLGGLPNKASANSLWIKRLQVIDLLANTLIRVDRLTRTFAKCKPERALSGAVSLVMTRPEITESLGNNLAWFQGILSVVASNTTGVMRRAGSFLRINGARSWPVPPSRSPTILQAAAAVSISSGPPRHVRPVYRIQNARLADRSPAAAVNTGTSARFTPDLATGSNPRRPEKLSPCDDHVLLQP